MKRAFLFNAAFAMSYLMTLEKWPFGVNNVKSLSRRHDTSRHVSCNKVMNLWHNAEAPSRTNYSPCAENVRRNMTDQARLRYKLWFMSRLTINTHTWYVHVHVVDLTSLTTALIMVNDVICITWRHYGSTNCVRSLLRFASRRRYKLKRIYLTDGMAGFLDNWRVVCVWL